MKTLLEHRFIEEIPEVKEEGVLYVSMEHCVAIHKCICGCGNDVVTPIDPSAWKLTFNGEAISLHPSIIGYQRTESKWQVLGSRKRLRRRRKRGGLVSINILRKRNPNKAHTE
jgi:hypothetical protein